MSIDIEPKWTRQQWRNFIDTRDVDLSRPYPEYRLIGIKSSVAINLPQVNPAPAPAANIQVPIVQGYQEDNQDGPEIQKKFNNLLQSPLCQSQRRLRSLQPDSSALWLEALLMCLVKTSLVMIHLLLRLWPVRQFLQRRTLSTKQLGSPIWPQQLGRHSGTLYDSWIGTLFVGIRMTER